MHLRLTHQTFFALKSKNLREVLAEKILGLIFVGHQNLHQNLIKFLH